LTRQYNISFIDVQLNDSGIPQHCKELHTELHNATRVISLDADIWNCHVTQLVLFVGSTNVESIKPHRQDLNHQVGGHFQSVF